MLFEACNFFVVIIYLLMDFSSFAFAYISRDSNSIEYYYILRLWLGTFAFRSLLMFSRRLVTPNEQRILDKEYNTWLFAIYWILDASAEWEFMITFDLTIFAFHF